MTKQNVTQYACYLSWYDLDGEKLTAIKARFDKLIQEYGENATLSISGEDIEMNIDTVREETDAEYSLRLSREKTAAESFERSEREVLARLQAKYGNT